MTDEMMVQAQKPSAMPYVLGGAGVGALGGLASAKYANFGVTTPKYSSWEEAINDSNDEFVKKQIEKGGDKKADWEKVQTAQNEVKEANKKITEATKDLKDEDLKKVNEYFEKLDALENEKEKALKELETKAKLEGDALKNFVDNADDVRKAQENVNKLFETISENEREDVRKLLTSAEDKTAEIAAKFGITEKPATEAIEAISVKAQIEKLIENDDGVTKIAKELKITEIPATETTGPVSVKTQIENLIKNDEGVTKIAETLGLKDIPAVEAKPAETIEQQVKNLKAEFERLSTALTNAENTAKETANSAENIKKRAVEMLENEANQPEAYKNAKKAVPEKPSALTETMESAIKAGKKELKAIKNKAKTTLTDDLLKGLKSASGKWTALAGAAILGLAGYLFAPKGEKV